MGNPPHRGAIFRKGPVAFHVACPRSLALTVAKKKCNRVMMFWALRVSTKPHPPHKQILASVFHLQPIPSSAWPNTLPRGERAYKPLTHEGYVKASRPAALQAGRWTNSTAGTLLGHGERTHGLGESPNHCTEWKRS